MLTAIGNQGSIIFFSWWNETSAHFFLLLLYRMASVLCSSHYALYSIPNLFFFDGRHAESCKRDPPDRREIMRVAFAYILSSFYFDCSSSVMRQQLNDISLFFFIIWITFHFTVSFRHFSNHLTLMSILFIFAELKPMKVIRPWLLADWIGCLSSIWTRSNKF